MIRLRSGKPTGDFLKFPYETNTNLHIHKVIPGAADESISATHKHIKCIDLVKSADGTEISIYIHTEPDKMPDQVGYSLERVQTSIDIGKVSKPYILTNAYGHFYLPIQSESLLYDLLEIMREMAGYVGIRVIPYTEQHDINRLAKTTDRKLNEIRKPVKVKDETDHPEKGRRV